MSIFAPRIFAERNAGDDFWFSRNLGTNALSGVRVSADNAMTVMAVYSAVRILAETVAQTPLIIYRNLPNGAGRDRARNHPLYSLLHDQPNEFQSAFEWREMMMGHLALRGNAYSEIIAGDRGPVDQLIPLHPDKVEVFRLDGNRIGYRHTLENGERRALTQDQVFHLRGLSSNGLVGLSPIDVMREAIGVSMAAEGYAARFFQNDATPGGHLKHPRQLSDDAHKRLKQWFLENHQGWAKSHHPAIFEEGMEWVKIGIEPEKAQLLLTRQFQVVEIARAFHVPPHLLADLSRATFSNIEQQSLEFVIYYMMPWFKRWEQRINMDLVLARQTFFAEFLLDNLLRGDKLSRTQAYGMAIKDGWMSRNEVRQRENLNPDPTLDRFLVPLNMAPAGSVGGEQSHYDKLFTAGMERICRKEMASLEAAIRRTEGNPDKLKDQVFKIYESFGRFISEVLCVSEDKGNNYAVFQTRRILEAIEDESLDLLAAEMRRSNHEWLLKFIGGNDEDHQISDWKAQEDTQRRLGDTRDGTI